MIYVDAPLWPAHGTVFAHVVSDIAADELHAFARRAGLDPRSWDGDHYDVPLRRYDDVVRAGATVVDGRTLTRLLAASGLRFRKRKGERPLASVPDGVVGLGGSHRLDILRSCLPAPGPVVASAVIVHDAAGAVLLTPDAELPRTVHAPGEEPGPGVARAIGPTLDPASLTPVGYERILRAAPGGGWAPRPDHVQVWTATLSVAGTGPGWVSPREALAAVTTHRVLLADHLARH